MIIGVDGSRAFVGQRTGIEEYSYQVIKHLIPLLRNDQVILYVRKNQKIELEMPDNWQVKIINWPYLWTQVGLSLEMLFHPVEVLFVPGHVVPPIYPQKTIATIHGLDHEFVPEAYSWWARKYMRWSIKKSCQRAEKIIAVSDTTKQNLMNLYKVPEGKITVIHEGCDAGEKSQFQNPKSQTDSKLQISNYKPYFFFIGRLEERKNVVGIIKAFEILKEKYKIPHKLILAGKSGFGYEEIKSNLSNSSYKNEIIETGFVSEAEKWELLRNADALLFPSLYESFGLPILEAQSMGVPVVTSNLSSMEEVADESAVLVDPNEPENIAERTNVLLSDQLYRDDIIKKGYENVKRFSWDKCTTEIAEILKK